MRYGVEYAEQGRENRPLDWVAARLRGSRYDPFGVGGNLLSSLGARKPRPRANR